MATSGLGAEMPASVVPRGFDCDQGVAQLSDEIILTIRDALHATGWLNDVDAGLTRPFCSCLPQLERRLRANGYRGGSISIASTARGLDYIYYGASKCDRSDLADELTKLEDAYKDGH